jgi:hypothetical protein
LAADENLAPRQTKRGGVQAGGPTGRGRERVRQKIKKQSGLYDSEKRFVLYYRSAIHCNSAVHKNLQFTLCSSVGFGRWKARGLAVGKILRCSPDNPPAVPQLKCQGIWSIFKEITAFAALGLVAQINAVPLWAYLQMLS